MQQLQFWNVVIGKRSEEKLVLILPNVVPFHRLLNWSVHNSRILNFEVLL